MMKTRSQQKPALMLPSTMVPDLYKKGKGMALRHVKTERKLRSMLGLTTCEGILAVSENRKKYSLQSQNENDEDQEQLDETESSPQTRACSEAKHSQGTATTFVVWELCSTARVGWIEFPPPVSQALEEAFKGGQESTSFIQDGMHHTANFAKMKFCRSDWPYILPSWAWTQKDIRRREWTVEGKGDSSGGGGPEDRHYPFFDSFSAWVSKPTKYAWSDEVEGVKIYEIHKSVLSNSNSVEVSKDLREFSFASMQFCRLLNKDPGSVVRVDAIVYEDSAVVLRNYRMIREKYAAEKKSLNEILVFHGTDEMATRSIAAEGFKIGGWDDGIGIKHGRCFGPGVYTAAGPATPAKYEFGGSGGRVILAKGLVGNPAPTNMHSPHNNFDSFYPNNDSIVFKDGKQLLPLYVVYFHPPSPYDYY